MEQQNDVGEWFVELYEKDEEPTESERHEMITDFFEWGKYLASLDKTNLTDSQRHEIGVFKGYWKYFVDIVQKEDEFISLRDMFIPLS